VSGFKTIQVKLEGFVRKYYTNELIKGAILFLAIGLLYFICTLLIEYVLWLNSALRTLLFWLFISVEIVLIIKLIALPIAKLFKLQNGIKYEDASKIIGKYFPEVNDKLLNVLQLHKEPSKTELLLASIDQKSIELSPIPFKLAINFKNNLKYLKYAAIPLVIVLTVLLTGNLNLFSDSFDRVMHYKTAYEPPAPFQFYVMNTGLSAIENSNFELQVKVSGTVIPENVKIHYGNEAYFLQQKSPGEFVYVFSKPIKNVRFELKANNVTSKPYELIVIKAPSLLSFEMLLNFPSYINKPSEILKSTGNTDVPEGTKVTWKLKTKSTDKVQLFSKDTLSFLNTNKDLFELSKKVYSDFSYSLSISNTNLNNYENLSFNINVIKDQSPELVLKMEKDSLDLQTLYFYGQISDDYGLSKLQLVYYPTMDENKKQYLSIPVSSSTMSEFITAFPNDLPIEEGISYSLYFQVFDNDVFHNYKSTKSGVFEYRKRTKEEEEDKNLREQGETIKDFNKSVNKFNEHEKELEKISKTQKEKSDLNFNDKKKLESFFNRQKQQDDMMKNFNKKLKDNLQEYQKEDSKEDIFKNDLEKRLQENEEQLKKDEKLLEELNRLQDKINREEFTQKLEELAKQNKNKKRSLEQILELTKRFYVGKKLEKLQQLLSELAIEQDKLSEEAQEKNNKEAQEKLNNTFDDFQKQFDKLEKDNKSLKKPLDVPRDKLDEQDVQESQQEAVMELNKSEQSQEGQNKEQSKGNAKKNQKKAAMKMQQMSKKMQQSMLAENGEQLQEDTDMLRQILDNTLLFSFNQETLMNWFMAIETNNNKYAGYLRKQSDLKEHFQHIDDSLFALSLRQPKLSEMVNKEITEVYFNMDKALAQFSENQLVQGVANQQFTITASNNLTNLLSNMLDNMDERLNPSGGKGDMQLPDIIMSQEELNKMMEKGIKKEEGKQQDGGKGKDEKKGTDTSNGNEGEGDKDNEMLYQIYQKQAELRQALEDKLSKEGGNSDGENVLKKMEEVEMDLLNKGFTNQTLQKMMDLEHQLLKLDNATFQQGEDNKRQSDSNKDQFKNTTNNQLPTAKQYFKTTEILNRQTLPLRPLYKRKVQDYFKSTNDKF
tara:strand:+ start:12928 stop:16254 length:3327 start_codon:yes stop_codon:yes gene_type:complete